MNARTAGAAALLATFGIHAAVPDNKPDHEMDENLARMEMRLTHREPYLFVLAYRGPTMPFRGLLCYYFAGYNETCLDPHVEWLTPATEIELFAPGGVPRDLLQGYMMLVRYPALSQRTFRYALRGD